MHFISILVIFGIFVLTKLPASSQRFECTEFSPVELYNVGYMRPENGKHEVYQCSVHHKIFEVRRVLGSGHHSVVFEANVVENGEVSINRTVVMKFFHGERLREFSDEVKALSIVSSNNISNVVKMIDHSDCNGGNGMHLSHVVILEYINGSAFYEQLGQYQQHIKDPNNPRMPTKYLISMIFKLLVCLQYILKK